LCLLDGFFVAALFVFLLGSVGWIRLLGVRGGGFDRGEAEVVHGVRSVGDHEGRDVHLGEVELALLADRAVREVVPLDAVGTERVGAAVDDPLVGRGVIADGANDGCVLVILPFSGRVF